MGSWSGLRQCPVNRSLAATRQFSSSRPLALLIQIIRILLHQLSSQRRIDLVKSLQSSQRRPKVHHCSTKKQFPSWFAPLPTAVRPSAHWERWTYMEACMGTGGRRGPVLTARSVTTGGETCSTMCSKGQAAPSKDSQPCQDLFSALLALRRPSVPVL